MTALPRLDAPRCPSCGCYLAADDPAPVCTPCVQAYRARRRRGYRPVHDATLRGRIVSVLLANAGRRVNLYQALGMWPAGREEWVVVKGHVRYLAGRRSRSGRHYIVGHPDGTYTYIGSRREQDTGAD